ncbi:MAG: hypothetical protein M5T61_11500 [Acidimicrobiia bacterium]|nr:hypothetical protein [Acidimicrobiia bacterium]
MSRRPAILLVSLLGALGPLLARSGVPAAVGAPSATPTAAPASAPTPTVAPAPAPATVAERVATPRRPPAPAPPDPRILVVGDSVLLGARDDVVSRLSGWETTVDAEVGRSTVGGLDVLRRERERIGDLVVVHLGHNDGASRELFRTRIDEVMAELSGVERVVWLDLVEFDAWVAGANEELAAAASRWPNLEIAPWQSVATSDPTYLYSDGIHLPPPGRSAMADLVGETVDSWVASRGPAPRKNHLGPRRPARLTQKG